MTKAEIYEQALDTVKERGKTAVFMAEQKKADLYAQLPELEMLDEKIKNVFANAALGSLSGKKVDFDEAEKQSLEYQRQKKEILSSIGMSEEDLQPKYSCSLCSDTGFYKGKTCNCVRELVSKIIYDELNRDVPLESSTFDTFDLKYYPDKSENGELSPRQIMARIKSACEKYAKNFSADSDSILFYGATGLGKTHLSLAIANEVIQKGFSVVYAPIGRVLQKIEAEHFSRDDNSNMTLNSVIECDLLIIDDLGTEFFTPFVNSTVYDIINTRQLSHKPTIINTNLSLAELEKRYSDRIVSRISNVYKKFYFMGKDIRCLK